MDFSNYLKNQVLNWIDGTNMDAAPATVYVALWNGDPTDDASGGTEVTATVRVAGRVAIPWGAIVGNESLANNGVVDFGASAGAVTVNYFAIFDNATPGAGNMIGHSILNNERIIAATDPVEFPIGDISVLLQ